MRRAHRHLAAALEQALRRFGLDAPRVILEKPRDAAHGDIAANAALTHARYLKRSPRNVAEGILAHLELDPRLIAGASVAGPGFINFTFAPEYLRSMARLALERGADFGCNDDLAGTRVLIEFVSANPSGPLNVVSARAAAVGDTLVRMFRARGAECQAEFYVNDAGNQIRLLGESVRAHLKTLRGEPAAVPEGGYHGEYLVDFARDLHQSRAELPDLDGDAAVIRLSELAVSHFVACHEASLRRFGVTFDTWFRESRLRDVERADVAALERLRAAGAVYERDGAAYVATERSGDVQDWVIVTRDGRFTYFLPDIAYHVVKYDRGFQHVIDILGPDHHSFTSRMKAAMRILGYDPDRLEVILLQHVTLLRDGEPVKMSKRSGRIIEMDELMDEVGTDAARYFFLLRRTSTPLDFDIELAKRQSDDNPVFYVQYAHARIESIFRKAGLQPPGADADLSPLTAPEELDLLRRLRELEDVLAETTAGRDPHGITVWLREVATQFHKFYHNCRVLTTPLELQTARLALCRATQIALQNGLALCGVSAPKEM